MPNTKNNKNKRYRISLIEDQSHETIWVFRLNKKSLFVSIISIITVVFAIAFMIIAFTPVKTLIPGYPYANTRLTAIKNQMKIDSLENIINKWAYYSENLKRVIDGDDATKFDSLLRFHNNYDVLKINQEKYRKQDSILRKNVMNTEKYVVSNRDKSLPIEGKHFFTPINGIVTKSYNENTRPYIEIRAASNSLAMATLNGTIISTSWSELNGYIIVIQHSDNIVSIYKNNEKVLKNVGEQVEAGTPIGIVGSTNKNNTTLCFELWYKGKPVNPNKYIKF